MIPVIYGYARVSKTDDATRNLETQLHILQKFGTREEHIFAGEMTGSSMSRSVRPTTYLNGTRSPGNSAIHPALALIRDKRNSSSGNQPGSALRKGTRYWHTPPRGCENPPRGD